MKEIKQSVSYDINIKGLIKILYLLLFLNCKVKYHTMIFSILDSVDTPVFVVYIVQNPQNPLKEFK